VRVCNLVSDKDEIKDSEENYTAKNFTVYSHTSTVTVEIKTDEKSRQE
jgi:hypothetical protein